MSEIVEPLANRDLDEITEFASQHGIMRPERIAIPANKLSALFGRR